METQQVSEYERLRLENIQRNEEYLQQLGFTESKSKRTLRSNVEEKVDSKKKRNKVNAIIEIPSRRSTVVELPSCLIYPILTAPFLYTITTMDGWLRMKTQQMS